MAVPGTGTTFVDHSGYGRTITNTGTPTKHVALVSDGGQSLVLGSATVQIESPVFVQGQESKGFTLEAAFRAFGTPSEQQVLGNGGQMDGIVVNGNVVSFIVRYANGTAAIASHNLQIPRAVLVHGVYNVNKVTLFVDGVPVAEDNATEEQQAAGFATTTSTLQSGYTAGSQSIAVNALGSYATPLSDESIARHNLIAKTVQGGASVASSHLGDRIDVSLETADVFLDQWWTTAEDWKEAVLENVVVQNERLEPQFEDGVSVPGQWLDSFSLEAADTTSIYGVVLGWDGEGVKVEVSLDTETWEEVQRGVAPALIPEGFDPTDKELQIRVSFEGEIENDTSYIDSLNVVGLKTAGAQEQYGRIVTYSNAVPERDYPPLQLNENWGTEIAAGGSVEISADLSDEATPARTVELWIRRNGTNPTLSVTGTTYINGASGSTTLPDGQWVLMHVVLAADHTDSIVINGPAQVGQVVIYETALTAAEVESVYKSYIGANQARVPTNSSIIVSDSDSGANIYAHDWSITASG